MIKFFPLPVTRLFLVLSLALFVSCKQGQETPPVARDKMSRILLDMQLAEAYSQGLGNDPRNKFEKNADSLTGFYTSVLKHYNLSFEDFEEALTWYKERPPMLDSLYSSVLTQLIEIKAKRGIKDTEEPPDKAAVPPDTNSFKADKLVRKDFSNDSISKKRTDSLNRKRDTGKAKR
ncbi:MAG: DUF4296 domain-containing protein [Sphingobacteriales bacterium]|nr:MAG: DUF4296 domain-containing protein [Sphingobacteriales bacterium]